MQINFKELRASEIAASNDVKNVHNELQHLSVPELQNISLADRMPWHVCCLNLSGDLNVGTVIRSAHLLGAKSVIIFGRTRIDNRSLVGAANYITVHRIAGLDENLSYDVDIFKKTIQDYNLVPIICESGGENLFELPWKNRINSILNSEKEPCLVLGNESNGIPFDIIEYVKNVENSFTVTIPMKGVIRSFNVASAFSIIASQLLSKMCWF
jgi:tRNA G18 (ribose-2'-O)-methylase SpoU